MFNAFEKRNIYFDIIYLQTVQTPKVQIKLQMWKYGNEMLKWKQKQKPI